MNQFPLPKRLIPLTGQQVTPIGLGAAWLGWAENDAIAVDATLRALERGINLIDTSPYYGDSERRLGLAFEQYYKRGGKREDFFLQTKTGSRGRAVGAPAKAADYSGPATLASVQESMRLLKTDYLDSVLIHDPSDLVPVLAEGGALDVLTDLKSKGVIRAVGLGTRQHQFHRVCLETNALDIVLTFRDYNLLDQTAILDVVAPAALKKVAVLNAAVLMYGLLGGRNPLEVQAERPSDATLKEAQRAHDLWDFCNARGISLLALNLQYCLRDNRVVSTLLGVGNSAELDADLDAIAMKIPDDVWPELKGRFGIKENDPSMRSGVFAIPKL